MKREGLFIAAAAAAAEGGNQCAAAAERRKGRRGGVENFSGTPSSTINLPSVGLEQRGRKTRVSPTYNHILQRNTRFLKCFFSCLYI